MTRILIAGGGLAGSLTALALAKRRGDIELLLVEQDDRFGGDHVWSFFDSDIEPDNLWLVNLVERRRWPDHEIRFPRRERCLPIGYNSIRSADLDRAVRARLRPDQYRTGCAIRSVEPRRLLLEGGEELLADAVIDARGPGPVDGLDLGWQKFLGRTYRFPEAHGVDRPMIMDACVDQSNGYRFVYLLPFSTTELLVEDTYYSLDPEIDEQALGRNLDRLSARHGGGASVVNEERGVLPVLLGGDIENLWSIDPGVAKLGLRGGFFHPTTGYSLPDAVRNAALLAGQRDLRATAVHTLFRNRAEELWTQRRFFQYLNRMLFRAASPERRYLVLEHFYRLSPGLVARFYAARLTPLDKLRIVSGRPPVPVGQALGALFGRSA